MGYDAIIGRRKGMRVIVKKKQQQMNKGQFCTRSFWKQRDEKFICIVVDVMSRDDWNS